ncbi:MAG: esterase, partial [Rhodococcus sp. (in: high G+C Gram-positive bacteria)]
GGAAAADVTIHRRLDIRIAHTVCLAGAFTAWDPTSGGQLAAELPDGDDRPPFTLLHGVADDIVPVAASRTFASTLKQNNWPVEFAELDADHGSIAGATYDPSTDSYSAAEDPESLAVAAEVAARIASATGR